MNVTDLRRISKGIFGNSYALEVLDAIATWKAGAFTQTELARLTGIGSGQVRLVIARLERAGLVERAERSKQEQPFRRAGLPSKVWDDLHSIHGRF